MKTIFNSFIYLGIILFWTVSLQAQDDLHKCGTDKALIELYQKHPASKTEAEQFNEITRTFIKQKTNHGRAGSQSYTVPVVFHIFGTNFLGATVDDAKIIESLEQVNIDFQGLNTDYNDVINHFKPLRSTLDITFELASKDPNGNATTGINYYAELSGFGNGSGYDSQIQQYAWDNNKYMNVYIMLDLYNDGTTNRSGVAWYPDQWMTDNNLARVVYNGRYLWNNHGDNEFQATLTHEFGHYLNLAHTFDNDCASPGDNVADTPATTSNTSCTPTETCSGAGIANTSNYMDYSDCRRMFTIGQVDRMDAALQNHAARNVLWQDANLQATGVGPYKVGANVSAASTVFVEDVANNGSIQNSLTISANNGAQFTMSSGTLTQGTHYNISNLPSGLSAQLTANSNTSLTLSLNGSANSHASDISNINLTFLNAAIVGGTSAIYSASINGFSIDNRAPYQYVYENITDLTITASNTWEPFTIPNNGSASFGVWYDGGKLRFETYQKSLVCEGTSRNISLLAQGTPINASSNWVAGGAYPDEHDIRNNSYTVWDGQSGYFGFQMTNQRNETVYGWFGATVSSNGNNLTITDYGYNEDPNGTSYAGTNSGGGNPPVANFSANVTTVEEGGSVSFTDSSTGNPTSWSWTFTGGSPASSSSQNPTVTYNTAGTYAVSLTATNNYGNDSETKTGYITVTTPSGPTYCASAGTRVSYEWIAGVQAGSFNNTSGAQLYSDYTSQTINLTRGQANSITLTPGFSGSAYNEYFKIWIDYNGDGDFNDAGEEAFDAGSASNSAVSGSITPAGSVALGTTRMRVSMKYNSAPTSCGNQGDGEVEDYTVNIQGGSTPAPVADFQANVTSVQEGGSVSFSDLSTNNPTSWSWTFTGGSPASSSSQNPTITYNTAGTYAVSLTATNAGGNGSETKTAYITVTGTSNPTYCESAGTRVSYEWIAGVQVGSFNNTSGAQLYTDNTSQTVNIQRGASNSITLTPGYSGSAYNEYWMVWIDYNKDGDFDDAGEVAYDSGSASNSAVSGSITPGGSVALGTTRMRVSMKYNSAPSSCGSIGDGEVEDYTVNITDSGASGADMNNPIQNKLLVSEINLYPNPNNGKFNVDISDDINTIKAIRIYSLNGKLVFEKSYASQLSSISETIDLSNATKGIYIMRIVGDKVSRTRKIIIK